ncbi:MAG TPA: phosphatidate cytidylyltransferase [Desulfotomaculum sp.]|nr:MAG: phosphatidate cytidylyltransferase [Desulfotomaculum sp. BICA1-6]HBX23779.1 phosphatidate cytidylyltransferase [Desulfotomaculum sp.]
MFGLRLLSALVGIPLLVAAVWYGGLYLLAVSAALMILGARELSRICNRANLQAPLPLMLAGCLVLLVFTYIFRDGFPGPAIITILLMYLIAVVKLYPRLTPLDAAITFAGTLYVGLILYFYLISTLSDGWIWLVFMLACTWASDTMAYLVGRKWGKHRIAPALSPGKTVEGAVGGVLGSILAAAMVIFFNPHLSVAFVLVLGTLVGIAAQVGDLVESAIKRQAGIKDAGGLIPGHGGILDRFDSMLFTAPLVYYYVGQIIIT